MRDRRTTVVDWPQVLSDMQLLLGDPLPGLGETRHPVGTRLLAEHLGYTRDQVRGWLQFGARPHYEEGLHLIACWCALTGKASAFVPMTRPVYSAARG